MKVAVFGCLHGMLNEMYAEVGRMEYKQGSEIDLIIVCGDCQTIRHADDLKCLSVPHKYRKLGDFHEYYSGKKKIPKLTIFVGGNHEASNYLMTLPYGGWVCENFYYLGYAGVIRYKGLRIAGVSGIYNFRNCNKGRFERLPLDDSTVKSVYHTRRLDVFRLQLLSTKANDQEPIDIFMSHDWPSRIYDHGNKDFLLRIKPRFYEDMKSRDGLGNPMTQPLVQQLKPKRWFAAHLHCKFFAKVVHDRASGKNTDFLSLNKIEGRRHFSEIIDFQPTRPHDDSDNNIYYDEEWLTILKKTINLESNSANNVFCPNIDDQSGKAYIPTDAEVQETVEMMNKTGGLMIKRNFKMTEPVIYNRPNGVQPSLDRDRVRLYPNFQTDELCSRLQLKKAEVKLESKDNFWVNFKEELGNTAGSSIKTEPQVKVEPEIKQESNVKQEPNVKQEAGIKVEHGVKQEHKTKGEPHTKGLSSIKIEMNPPAKKRAFDRDNEPVELDVDGCLPFYIDTKGD